MSRADGDPVHQQQWRRRSSPASDIERDVTFCTCMAADPTGSQVNGGSARLGYADWCQAPLVGGSEHVGVPRCLAPSAVQQSQARKGATGSRPSPGRAWHPSAQPPGTGPAARLTGAAAPFRSFLCFPRQHGHRPRLASRTWLRSVRRACRLRSNGRGDRLAVGSLRGCSVREQGRPRRVRATVADNSKGLIGSTGPLALPNVTIIPRNLNRPRLCLNTDLPTPSSPTSSGLVPRSLPPLRRNPLGGRG